MSLIRRLLSSGVSRQAMLAALGGDIPSKRDWADEVVVTSSAFEPLYSVTVSSEGWGGLR
jgi:hypothetical protein